MSIYQNPFLSNRPRRKKIKFVSAGCATGKTRAVCHHIRDNLNRRNFMYCARSIELIRETAKVLADLGEETKVITSDDPLHQWRVKKDIAAFLEEAPNHGAVLLITANARIDLTHSVDESWEVFFDEVPQVDTYYPWMLPRHQEFITNHIELDPSESTEGRMLVKVGQTFDSELDEIIRAVPDDIDKVMRSFYSDVLSPGKEMFVHLDSFQRICERRDVATERGKEECNKVHFISMLKPAPFVDATVVGANIEDSLFFHWFRDWHNIEFEENTEISRRLRKMPENIGERLKVSYFIPGNRFGSKYLFGKEATEGVSNLEQMHRLALAAFKGEPFLYVPNNETKSAIDDEPKCARAPVVCHGLNRYSGYHNVYCPIALNREPFHLNMLEKGFGLSREVIHRATAQETIYQIVSRTSLRIFDSTAPVHAIVPDYATARHLAELYGSTQVSQLGSVFQMANPLSAAEKQRRYRERQKAAKTCELTLASIEPPMDDDDSLFVTVTTCGNRFAKSRADFSLSRVTISDFMAFLRELSLRKVTKKEEGLFNLSVFDPPENADDYRKLDHFKSASGLVLDFDNGEVSPQEFERIFWTEAGRGRKISFAIMNTFSRTPETPNKFRVVIPFSRPAQSVDEFRAAYDYIVRRIEERGYGKPPSAGEGPNLDAGGVDRSSRNPTQPFYWPCTNAAFPGGAFFRSYGLQKRELGRHALDPHEVAKNAPAPSVAAPMPALAARASQTKVDEAIREWREEGCTPGNGNDGFYHLGLRLLYAGMDDYEIRSTLTEQARYANTPKDRRRNIPHVMASLGRRRVQGLGAAGT